MKKRCLFLLLFLSISSYIFAQDGTLNGTVTDAQSNEPLLGASVVVKGTNNGASTDFDGNFILEGVKVGDVLQVTYIGYGTKVSNGK